MIIVKFTSGLGNQMFQYNLYSLLRERFPETEVLADVSWFYRSGEHQGFELEKLFLRKDNPDFVFEKAGWKDILRCTGRIPNYLSGLVGDIYQQILKVPHFFIRKKKGDYYKSIHIDQSGFENNEDIIKAIEDIDPLMDCYISGFFIEEAYYRDRLNFLRKALRFDENFSDENKRIAKMISESDSVSIHVRRGDYLSEKYNDSFMTLPMDYYREGVKKALQEYPLAKFFVFSDDKEFIEREFSWIEREHPGKERLTVVSNNTGANSFRDMQLMSLCKNNIIANSTFSVWAGLLNCNSCAKIYYPSAYMKKKDSEEKTIPGWTRIG